MDVSMQNACAYEYVCVYICPSVGLSVRLYVCVYIYIYTIDCI